MTLTPERLRQAFDAFEAVGATPSVVIVSPKLLVEAALFDGLWSAGATYRDELLAFARLRHERRRFELGRRATMPTAAEILAPHT